MLPDNLIADLVTLGSVVVIDLVLAGDNAIVVGMAACGLPPDQRRRAIALGILMALIFRIAFAVVAVQLLAIVGLLLAGGLLLLWVAWKMWRELRAAAHREPVWAGHAPPAADRPPAKSFATAAVQIVIADVSMSLDNVLAVAGTARHNIWILAFGLILSVALMGVAATLVARFMTRYPWLSYLGLLIVTVVALSMIYDGSTDVFAAIANLD